jgi:hypothetical protein
MQSARVLLVLGVDSICETRMFLPTILVVGVPGKVHVFFQTSLAFSEHLSIEMGAECQRGRAFFWVVGSLVFTTRKKISVRGFCSIVSLTAKSTDTYFFLVFTTRLVCEPTKNKKNHSPLRNLCDARVCTRG